jgi:dihydrofolate synthase/folylpolyglutamate synthase
LKIEPYLYRTIWQGRLEIVQKQPLFILDGCHNPQGAATVVDFVHRCMKDKKIILIFGAVKDKDVQAIAQILSTVAELVITTELSSSRSCDASSLAQIFSQHGKAVTIARNADNAVSIAQNMAEKQDVILACGSLYLIGEMKNILLNKNTYTIR